MSRKGELRISLKKKNRSKFVREEMEKEMQREGKLRISVKKKIEANLLRR